MIKILHTGDFHIGASLSKFKNPKKAHEFLINAIKNMINFANINMVDVILISGDTFDSQDVENSLKREVLQIFEGFLGKIFIVLGNHDYYFMSSVWSNLDLPQNIKLFTENSFESYNFSEDVVIHGASFTNIYDNIKLPTVDESKINIALVHSDILTNSHYNFYDKAKISQSKLCYLAVGHNHRYSEVLKEGGVHFASAGNISAVAQDEIGEKGFILAEISKENKKFSFIPSGGLCILPLEIDVSAFKTLNDLTTEILKNAKENVILKLNLTGICDLDEDIFKLSLQNYFFDVEICDNTKNIESLFSHINHDSLIGEYTRILHEKYKETSDRNVLIALDLGQNLLI